MTRKSAPRGIRTKNGRRIDLITKKYHRGGLTEVEAAELATLQHEVAEHVQKVYPRSTDVLDEFDAHIESLRKKVLARRAK